MCKQAANGFVWPVVQKNGLDHTFAMVASDKAVASGPVATTPLPVVQRIFLIDSAPLISLR
jgi:hypothetical protein